MRELQRRSNWRRLENETDSRRKPLPVLLAHRFATATTIHRSALQRNDQSYQTVVLIDLRKKKKKKLVVLKRIVCRSELFFKKVIYHIEQY